MWRSPSGSDALSSLLSILNKEVRGISNLDVHSIREPVAWIVRHISRKRNDYRSFLQTVIQGRLLQRCRTTNADLRREESG